MRLHIPIFLEARIGLERVALNRDPVLRGQGVPRGDGMPVLLIPGFLAGDLSLGVMARWLGTLGYEPCRSGIRANVDCTSRVLERLGQQLECLVGHYGRRVSIVGQSRGGSMARILAVRHPDLVERIVTLGSPLTEILPVHPLVRAQVEAVAMLGSLGVQGFFSHDCGWGPCCELSREQAFAAFPGNVGFTSIYSRTDGIVDWNACLDPAAEHIEVHSSHLGMAVNAEVYRAVGSALAPEIKQAHAPSRVVAVRNPDELAA